MNTDLRENAVQKQGRQDVSNKVNRFQVLSVFLNCIDREQTFQTIRQWISQKQKQYINVCSVQTVLDCYDSPDLTRIVNNSGLSVPDGMPLVWIGKLGGNRVERIYGPDLVLALCERGQDLGFRHYFYGGAPGFNERMMENLLKRFPHLQIAGNYSPPFRNLTPEEEKETAEMINRASPDILWVGLGTPKQDYWMDRMRPLLDAPLLIAVGAAFDLHSGRIRQAPIWMRRVGLEWSFRLLMEPRRLWRRYLFGNPRFIFLTLCQWIRNLLRKKS